MLQIKEISYNKLQVEDVDHVQLPPLGILGLGYLGKTLCQLPLPSQSWGSYHQQPALPSSTNNTPLTQLPFKWDQEPTWDAIPKHEAILLLTIPPVHQSIQAEEQRLHTWCQWMQEQRPQLKRLIYISSTSVYPQQDGIWREANNATPDTLKGQLRLMTEHTLSQYFSVSVIRPGGIYGPGRNLLQRLQQQKPLFAPQKVIHRIHVEDLARLVLFIGALESMPACVNAVDLEPASSQQIVEWLQTQPSFIEQSYPDPIYPEASTPPIQRTISNQYLIEPLQFTFKYPSFREGLLG